MLLVLWIYKNSFLTENIKATILYEGEPEDETCDKNFWSEHSHHCQKIKKSSVTEVYSELTKTYKIELFGKKYLVLQPLTIFAWSSLS